jgi:membrane fusion protein (multidrug efflux system)
MFARVTAVFGERADARVIPEEAIVPDGTAPYVLRIVPGKEEGSKIAKRTPVRLGARTPGFVEVVEGLAAGDVVVTAGQQRLPRDGLAVRVVELGQSAGDAKAASALTPAASAADTAAAVPAATSATVVAISTRAASAASPQPGLPDARAANPCQGGAEPAAQPGASPARAARGARSS